MLLKDVLKDVNQERGYWPQDVGNKTEAKGVLSMVVKERKSQDRSCRKSFQEPPSPDGNRVQSPGRGFFQGVEMYLNLPLDLCHRGEGDG